MLWHDCACYLFAYYCQAWALVWDGKPIFSEKIEAWANGSAVRELYDAHPGMFKIHDWPRDGADALLRKRWRQPQLDGTVFRPTAGPQSQTSMPIC